MNGLKRWVGNWRRVGAWGMMAAGLWWAGCSNAPTPSARVTHFTEPTVSAGPAAGQPGFLPNVPSPVPAAIAQEPPKLPISNGTPEAGELAAPPILPQPTRQVVIPPQVPIATPERNAVPTIQATGTGHPGLETWVPWDAWVKEHRIQGALLAFGQHYMRWHGALNYLGFEPRQTNGQLFINRLDVEKSLLPFLLPGLPWERTNRTIVLDPGHGGVNGGTQSARGRLVEKNLTLDWARRLKPLLEARGWHVLMTRTNDVDMALAERVDFSEASRASLFVSLHFNSGAGNLNASGIETYCLTPVGMSSTITRDYVDDSGKAYPNNRFDAENVRLAMSVHRSLLSTTGAADRGVRRARFMDVLRWQSRPAILIEGGYLTNPTESQRLAEPAYRQKLAEAVARALD